ncbi:SpoVT / AbrB like domain protein [Jeotgalicoccus saudimassiliensis]|uniref:SpoVT / AbrB like domain protein n=1 Tax=Jeotgalicoccus saudimassiliensis TaxID=1461582 RepID=A0A078M730_9STAP|nr:AbrB/MazE/SpoVT family DNA-binding domain-containing protein [Jeotgalicoccus saudimassiliensis]CEA00516.1 SpoVT / AbrB like domain protein [Jeotgalicoccus saudimassiliensis]
MNTELKIFKSGNSQAISIKKKTMEEMGLKIGDRLNIEKINDEMILTKKEGKSFKEEWTFL